MSIKITIQFDDGHNRMTTVHGFCTLRADIDPLIEHMLATEAVRHAKRGDPHADVTVTMAARGGGARVIGGARLRALTDEPPQGGNPPPELDNQTPAQKRISTIARRNQTYVEPRAHMLAVPLTLKAHDDLRQYINAMPSEIQGLEFQKRELHRIWWDWYDAKILAPSVQSICDVRGKTIRIWLGEWLMMRFELFDFVGRQERLKVQQWVAALKAGRMNNTRYDAHISTVMLRLHRMINSHEAKIK
jgi:hypothetical protein